MEVPFAAAHVRHLLRAVRIFTLLVVGCSFYLGGWLYRKIELLE